MVTMCAAQVSVTGKVWARQVLYLGNDSSAAYTIVLHAVELVSILIFRLYSLMTIGTSLGRVNVAEQLVTQQPGDSG